jgi:hypothetical protein
VFKKNLVFIFVEYIYKMQHLEVSGAVVLYIGRTCLKVNGASYSRIMESPLSPLREPEKHHIKNLYIRFAYTN